MKLIEALKEQKALAKKNDDLKKLVRDNSAYLSNETPPYGDNTAKKIEGWIQSYSDNLKRILYLRTAVARTNLATQVTIAIGGKEVTQSIAEWIHRRRDLAIEEYGIWAVLTDRGLKERTEMTSTGQKNEIKIVRNYDPETRDDKMSLFKSEPLLIDAQLEIINAITDVIEDEAVAEA